jgi:hypothetical protein
MKCPMLLAAVAAVALAAPQPATATTLITFDDASPGSSNAVLRDTSINHAVQWTQTVDATNVTLSAILRADDPPFQPVPPTLSWYVTDALGVGTTAADIIASGTVLLPTFPFEPDFDAMPLTTLATGLNLAAGTYYLVFDGPATGDGEWYGDFTGVTTTLAPGFSIGSYFATTSPDPFAPASAFAASTSSSRFVFELEGKTAVPEPSTWAMMLVGLGAVGFAMRRKQRPLAQAA